MLHEYVVSKFFKKYNAILQIKYKNRINCNFKKIIKFYLDLS